jgi:hypothetical protein
MCVGKWATWISPVWRIMEFCWKRNVEEEVSADSLVQEAPKKGLTMSWSWGWVGITKRREEIWREKRWRSGKVYEKVRIGRIYTAKKN